MELPITIPDSVWDVLRNYTLQEETINDLLRAVIEENTGEMENLVGPYMDHQRGALSDGITLSEDDELSFDTATNKGSFWIKFQEEAYYGCSDLNDFPWHNEEINFTLDVRSHTLFLTFADARERDTVEEF